MKLPFLKALSDYFSTYETFFSLRRIQDNLFRLTLDFDVFYIDVTRGKSRIFTNQEKLLGCPYNAPFDLLLSKLSRSQILSCKLDGENRILIFELLVSGAYKQEKYKLHFELTGRHTNVILVSADGLVLEALRHIGSNQRVRVIKPHKPFVPLSQPKNPSSSSPKPPVSDLKELLIQEGENRRRQLLEQKKQTLLQSKLKKLQALQAIELPSPEDLREKSRKYASYGEWILTSLHQLDFFSPHLELQDHKGQSVHLSLPDKIGSYSQAINYFYNQSKKCKQKLEKLMIQEEQLRSKIVFLQNQIAYIKRIESEQELQAFLPQVQHKQGKHQKSYESFFIDGIKISMGKNSKENQSLLEDARADDLWLHIKDLPSSHMIIHCGKGKVREEVLMEGAKILLRMSGIFDKNVCVDYTQRRFVKIVQGANVVYSKYKTLRF